MTASSLTADQTLEACRQLGLRYEPDLRQSDGLWRAQCPLCIVYTGPESRHLEIREKMRVPAAQLRAVGQIQVLGHSPVPLASVYTNQGTWGGVTYSDMTYYTDPTSQAGVVDTGTVNWINALAPCAASSPACPATLVQRITGNLLWLFGQGPSGRTTPSVANTQSIQPPGS